MNKPLVLSLRAVLILLLAAALTAQILIPFAAEKLGGPFEEVSHLVAPYSVAGILSLLCWQVALVVVWRLLSLVSRRQFLATRSIKSVGAIIYAVAGAALLPALTMLHLLFVAGVGGPGVVLGVAFCLICGAALVVVLIVMRALLAMAAENQGGLDEVIQCPQLDVGHPTMVHRGTDERER
ncbi:DUF2975 domain-containing protein [Zhihengliuella sp.]|uniref:DUF2975 domain-containing protein n=1 Tax=Zhihengliuella sp. TaxID=1954483 RepID=UPI002811C42D|nr:DUF2975 domain-containing protein [Zhihengliuella sp.]